MTPEIAKNELDFIRNGGETKRYHTWPTLREQTVAAHSFHVAMLCNWLAAYEAPGLRVALLMAALTHDLAEHKMGDLPAPVKRALPDIEGVSFHEYWGAMEEQGLEGVSLAYASELNEREAQILKVADAADGCLHCIRERAMGNKLIEPVYINFIAYLASAYNAESERQARLFDYVTKEWTNACK